MNDILSSLNSLPEPMARQASPASTNATRQRYQDIQRGASQMSTSTTTPNYSVPPTPPPTKPRHAGPPTAVPSDSDRPQYTTIPYNPYEFSPHSHPSNRNSTAPVHAAQSPQQTNSTDRTSGPPPPPGPPPAIENYSSIPASLATSSSILSPPISSNSRSESPVVTFTAKNMSKSSSLPPWKQPYQAAQIQTPHTAIYSPPSPTSVQKPAQSNFSPSRISQKPMINLGGLSNRKAVGEQAVNLANMLGQVASRKTPIQTNKPMFELALLDREAEIGEPCVLEVRVKNAHKNDDCVSVQWYYNEIPVREDLDRDIRVLALTKGANLSVFTMVLGEFSNGYQGNYEVQITNKFGQSRSSCHVRGVPPGTLERQRLANQELVGKNAANYYEQNPTNPTGISPAIQQTARVKPPINTGFNRITQDIDTGTKLISSNNVGLYSNANVNHSYNTFASDVGLPEHRFSSENAPDCQGYTSDVMTAIQQNNQVQGGNKNPGRTHQFLNRNYQN